MVTSLILYIYIYIYIYIYRNFQKAFDSIPHKRLLSTKIKSYGIEDNTVNWINNFLNNRRQHVLINSTCSVWKKVLSGFPRAASWANIICHINDIIDNLNSQAYLLADEMKLYRRINNDKDYNVLQSDINKVDEWTRLWLLKLNSD